MHISYSTARPFQRALLSAALLATGLFTSAARADLSFQFNFSADPGAPSFSAAQQNAVVTAGQLFSQMFATHFTNTASLQFNVISQTDGLAAATSEIQFNGGLAGEVVLHKVTAGVDLNGSINDGNIYINLATNFQYNPSAPVDFDNGQIDLFSVMDHELTHAFGFGSLIQTGFNDHAKFDTFLTTLSGTRLVNAGGTVNAAAFNEASLNNGLFDGAKTLAKYGGAAAIQGQSGDPTAFSGGLSHLGTVAFSAPPGGSPNQNALMLCCGGVNVTGEPRDYNAAEIGIMADLGYTLAAVPEPESYALMLAGLGIIGCIGRRRLS